MILENDGNLTSGKVETHSRDEAAPLADQVKEITLDITIYCMTIEMTPDFGEF